VTHFNGIPLPSQPFSEMTSTERVRTALDFRTPDYVPVIQNFWWEFADRWRRREGLTPLPGLPYDDVVEDFQILTHYGIDIVVAVPDETPWPDQARHLSEDGNYIIYRDGWGRIMRGKPGADFAGRPLDLPLKEKSDLDRLPFEPSNQDARYTGYLERVRRLREGAYRPYIATKVGGPFFRPTHLRGFEQWLIDIVEDPDFARVLSERVADHQIQVALEAIKRSDLWESSVWIFDDCADNDRLQISPATYEGIFLPQIARMVNAFKSAGVRHVVFHSDGNIRDILDGLVDAGIDAINPVEPRAGMDVPALRSKYGESLAYIGGLCNSEILPAGTSEQVRTHVERVVQAGKDGGLVIGSHSIGPDISLERFEFVVKLLAEHGRPLPSGRSPR
jgi:uroporphyrinogen decarboxylase